MVVLCRGRLGLQQPAIRTKVRRKLKMLTKLHFRNGITGDIDTTSSTGRLVFGLFATLAEFERDLIHERTMAGLKAARARGRRGGRPRMMTRSKLRTAMAMMADPANAAGEIAEQLGISLSTLYAYVDGHGAPQSQSSQAAEPGRVSTRCRFPFSLKNSVNATAGMPAIRHRISWPDIFTWAIAIGN